MILYFFVYTKMQLNAVNFLNDVKSVLHFCILPLVASNQNSMKRIVTFKNLLTDYRPITERIW